MSSKYKYIQIKDIWHPNQDHIQVIIKVNIKDDTIIDNKLQIVLFDIVSPTGTLICDKKEIPTNFFTKQEPLMLPLIQESQIILKAGSSFSFSRFPLHLTNLALRARGAKHLDTYKIFYVSKDFAMHNGRFGVQEIHKHLL